MTPSLAEVEAYLHAHIPLSAAMGVRLAAADATGVVLEAPLAPNLNHRGTAFGGSIATLATLAAWAYVYARLRAEGREARVVIRRSSVDYRAPIAGPLTAVCPPPDEAAWQHFVEGLAHHGKGRLDLAVRVEGAPTPEGPPGLGATFAGTFVALRLAA